MAVPHRKSESPGEPVPRLRLVVSPPEERVEAEPTYVLTPDVVRAMAEHGLGLVLRLRRDGRVETSYLVTRG